MLVLNPIANKNAELKQLTQHRVYDVIGVLRKATSPWQILGIAIITVLFIAIFISCANVLTRRKRKVNFVLNTLHPDRWTARKLLSILSRAGPSSLVPKMT
jgi:hypothetical protein